MDGNLAVMLVLKDVNITGMLVVMDVNITYIVIVLIGSGFAVFLSVFTS
jgi:hypothetical protein